MKNAILTYAEGDDFVGSLDSEIFLNSLKKHKTFVKIVFTKNLNNSNLSLLNRYFDEVIQCDHLINNHARDRFLAYYQWMTKNYDNFDYVMHLDFRDIILQKDPFEFMKKHLDKEIFVVAEGMQIKDNSWNNADMAYYYSFLQSHKYYFGDNFVINGGTIGGQTFPVSQLFLLLWTNSNRLSRSNTDQATLNYLYPYLKANPKIMVCHPKDDTFCATGEAIKYGNIRVNFNNLEVCNINGESYSIFHQWDRTEIASQIRFEQSKLLSFYI